MTYNSYITKGVQDGTIEEVEYCGVRIYKVRRPAPGEEVVGYIPFSGFLAQRTVTEDSVQ